MSMRLEFTLWFNSIVACDPDGGDFRRQPNRPWLPDVSFKLPAPGHPQECGLMEGITCDSDDPDAWVWSRDTTKKARQLFYLIPRLRLSHKATTNLTVPFTSDQRRVGISVTFSLALGPTVQSVDSLATRARGQGVNLLPQAPSPKSRCAQLTTHHEVLVQKLGPRPARLHVVASSSDSLPPSPRRGARMSKKQKRRLMAHVLVPLLPPGSRKSDYAPVGQRPRAHDRWTAAFRVLEALYKSEAEEGEDNEDDEEGDARRVF
ncbi:hypothetical protein V8E53_005900 [Lactarius tabidus]